MKFKSLIVVFALMFALTVVPDAARAGCMREGLKVKKAKCKPGGTMKLLIWCSKDVEKATISLNGCALTQKRLGSPSVIKFGVRGLEPGEYTVAVENPNGPERWEKVITCN